MYRRRWRRLLVGREGLGEPVGDREAGIEATFRVSGSDGPWSFTGL